MDLKLYAIRVPSLPGITRDLRLVSAYEATDEQFQWWAKHIVAINNFDEAECPIPLNGWTLSEREEFITWLHQNELVEE